MTEPGDQLIAMARCAADVYVACSEPRAILLTGSVARGEVDHYSDLDLLAYYETLPSDEELQAARERVGGADYTSLGPRANDGVVERYNIAGVECQVGHVPIEHEERDIAAVVDDLSLDAMAHKKLIGLLEGVPLHGAELIWGWQARAAFPEALAPVMVEHYLRQLVPVWYIAEHLARRDATLWAHQMLVESAFSLLGVLAGLNRRYFSTFQLKRMRHLIDQMPLAPMIWPRASKGFSPSIRRRRSFALKTLCARRLPWSMSIYR